MSRLILNASCSQQTLTPASLQSKVLEIPPVDAPAIIHTHLQQQSCITPGPPNLYICTTPAIIVQTPPYLHICIITPTHLHHHTCTITFALPLAFLTPAHSSASFLIHIYHYTHIPCHAHTVVLEAWMQHRLTRWLRSSLRAWVLLSILLGVFAHCSSVTPASSSGKEGNPPILEGSSGLSSLTPAPLAHFREDNLNPQAVRQYLLWCAGSVSFSHPPLGHAVPANWKQPVTHQVRNARTWHSSGGRAPGCCGPALISVALNTVVSCPAKCL